MPLLPVINACGDGQLVFFQRSKKAEYCSEKLYGYGQSKVWLLADHTCTFDSQP